MIANYTVYTAVCYRDGKMGYLNRKRFAVVFCLLLLLGCTRQAPRSPFQGLEWQPTGVVCYIDNQRYQLKGVGNVDIAALLESCKKQFGQNWITVFESDFDAVLGLLNLEGNAVSLNLLSLADSTTSRQTIPMLEENIQLLKTYRLEYVERINRPLPDSLASIFSPAARTFRNNADPLDKNFLPAELILKDLSQIEWLLENHSIHLKDSLNIYREAIDALRFVGQDGMSADDFYTEALLFFASCRKNQPAMRIRAETTQSNTQQLLPIHIHEVGRRLAAFSTGNNTLLNADHPYLVQINGIAVEQWLSAASDIYGSPFLDETRDVEVARVNLVSRRFGVEPEPGVMLGLESEDGTSIYVKQIKATDLHSGKQHITPDTPEKLEGYIFPGNKHPLEMELLKRQLNDAASARALIFDLRQTTNLALSDMAEILALMMSPQATPFIVATQQWRNDEWKDARSPQGFAPSSNFFPHSYSGWNPAERSVIQTALRMNSIPGDSLHFSEPHFLLATPGSGSLEIKQAIIWLTDHSSSGNAMAIVEAARHIFKRSYHIGVPLGEPVGSFISRELASGAEIEIVTSRIMDGSLSSFPNRLDPDQPLFKNPEDLLEDSQPILRAVNRFLNAPLRTAGSY